MTARATVDITGRRLSLFRNSLWCLPVLPFDFGGIFCRSSNSIYQLYIVGDLFLFCCYLNFPQLVDPLWLVSADPETFSSTAWGPCLPAFTQVRFTSGKPCACAARIHSFQCPLRPNFFSALLGGVVYDTVYNRHGGGSFCTSFIFSSKRLLSVRQSVQFT